MRAWVLAALLGAASGVRADGQRFDDGRAGVVGCPARDTVSQSTDSAPVKELRVATALRPYAAVISAIIPGGGQVLLHQDRFVAYAAIEAVSLWRFAKSNREQHLQENAYKYYARSVARRDFLPNGPDADWTYYEALRDRRRSGAFSLSPTELVPETDTATFNGNKWFIAQRTTGDRASALEQYKRTAYPDQLSWSWAGADYQWDIFKRTTALRNDAHESAHLALEVLAANHLLSFVDALTVLRLSATTDQNGRTSIGAHLRW